MGNEQRRVPNQELPRHRLLATFFGFGTVMCCLTIALLLFPGTALDSLWRINPEAHEAFQGLGVWAVLLMVVVGSACAAAAIGLWQGASWGVPIALTILSINIIGDLANVVMRHDYRSLIGVPIGGAMIFYLARSGRQ